VLASICNLALYNNINIIVNGEFSPQKRLLQFLKLLDYKNLLTVKLNIQLNDLIKRNNRL
jgi:hypothetical protein